MNELLIIAAIATVLLLIIILIIFIARKRISNNEKLINHHVFPEPATQAEENKLANELKVDTEPKKEASCPTETNSKVIAEPQTNKTAIQAHKVSDDNLPQDFMLRRHYLTNLRAMIVTQQLQPPKILAEPLLKVEINREDSVSQHKNLKLPEDSMLRRHAITNLHAIVESNMPIRPADSVLRRHYDTMINTEINKLLGCKVV